VRDLPVSAPPRRGWFSPEFGAEGHPLESAGIRVDDQLRPLDPGGEPLLENVQVVGSLLAGMRYLGERCGDGVAIASAHRAAGSAASRGEPQAVSGAPA
jgi:glycerol-3-phosphate dehydrogenase subunit B